MAGCIGADFLGDSGTLIAKEIYNIRESKNALVRGQADNMPKDGEQLKIMLANLEEQEAAMTEMFSGTLTVFRFFSVIVNEKDENVFGHACREHVAADESVGTNREGETCS